MTMTLSRRLMLEAPNRQPDGAGGFTETWDELGYVWAEIDTIGAGVDGAPEGLGSTLRTRITVRAAPVGSSRRPRPDQRLRDGTRVFEIDAVTEADHALYLWVWAREAVLQ
ncbi:MAG: head-tail adaptor protein [Pseudomonadota bacterium]